MRRAPEGLRGSRTVIVFRPVKSGSREGRSRRFNILSTYLSHRTTRFWRRQGAIRSTHRRRRSPPPVVPASRPFERKDVTDHQVFTVRTQAVQLVYAKARGLPFVR